MTGKLATWVARKALGTESVGPWLTEAAHGDTVTLAIHDGYSTERLVPLQDGTVRYEVSPMWNDDPSETLYFHLDDDEAQRVYDAAAEESGLEAALLTRGHEAVYSMSRFAERRPLHFAVALSQGSDEAEVQIAVLQRQLTILGRHVRALRVMTHPLLLSLRASTPPRPVERMARHA